MQIEFASLLHPAIAIGAFTMKTARARLNACELNDSPARSRNSRVRLIKVLSRNANRKEVKKNNGIPARKPLKGTTGRDFTLAEEAPARRFSHMPSATRSVARVLSNFVALTPNARVRHFRLRQRYLVGLSNVRLLGPSSRVPWNFAFATRRISSIESREFRLVLRIIPLEIELLTSVLRARLHSLISLPWCKWNHVEDRS